MRYILLFLLSVLWMQQSFAQSKKILFHTNYGDIKVMLYDYTPKHRDLIMAAIKDSVYQQALFNRIIKDFVVQGGEHDADIEIREKANPGIPKARLAPEFDDRAYHKIGALGAGRDDNRTKGSFLNQLYFVVGKPVTASYLDELTAKKGVVFTNEQRHEYLKNGGLPRLDKDYTVFGEIYDGLDVIMEISKLKTDSNDYPLQPVQFHLSEIKK